MLFLKTTPTYTSTAALALTLLFSPLLLSLVTQFRNVIKNFLSGVAKSVSTHKLPQRRQLVHLLSHPLTAHIHSLIYYRCCCIQLSVSQFHIGRLALWYAMKKHHLCNNDDGDGDTDNWLWQLPVCVNSIYEFIFAPLLQMHTYIHAFCAFMQTFLWASFLCCHITCICLLYAVVVVVAVAVIIVVVVD